jgi:hypothetical protein
VAQARAVAVALAVRGGTRRALERRMPIVSRLAIAAAVLTALGARTASAQVAGVIAPPPAPPPQAPPAVAAVATPSAAARRDSLALAQRLDIQAWVDSAAGALARGEPASTVPLAPPTTAPSPAPDSTQRPTPRSRRPTPPRRPLGTARPDDALVLQGRDTHVTAR